MGSIASVAHALLPLLRVDVLALPPTRPLPLLVSSAAICTHGAPLVASALESGGERRSLSLLLASISPSHRSTRALLPLTRMEAPPPPPPRPLPPLAPSAAVSARGTSPTASALESGGESRSLSHVKVT